MTKSVCFADTSVSLFDNLIPNTTDITIMNKQFRQNTNALYATFQKAATYKNKKQYTDKSWNNMVKQRNNAWTILYTPGATNKQCHKAEQSLKRSLKGLRRKHG